MSFIAVAPETATAAINSSSAQPALQLRPNERGLRKEPLEAVLPWPIEQALLVQGESAGVPALAPSRPAPTPAEVLGSVKASGEVVLNGSRVPQVATIYPDDTLRTGPDGNAVIKFPGKGEIQTFPETLIKFSNSSRSFAQLLYGHIIFRALGQVKAFQVSVGSFVIVPDPDSPEMTADIEQDPAGSARIRAVEGSVGVIELDGPQTSFIRSGQEVSISPDGKISEGPPRQGSSPATPSRVGNGGGGRHVPLILLGVGGAGAAGAAVALSGGSNSLPTSPATP